MSSVSDVAGLIAGKSLDDWAVHLGQQGVIKATKAAALAAGHDAPGPSDDFGVGVIPFDAHPELKGEGFQSYLMAPRVYKDAPELFYGPFLQVGTFLKDSGVTDSEVVRWGLDLALDPLNLVSFGTAGLAEKAGLSGLTALGKAQRVIGWLSEGGKITEGAKVIDKAHEILTVAGKVAGSSEAITAAAKAGDKGALKVVLSGALASDAMPEEYRAVTEALKTDRNALGKMLEQADKFKDITLGPRDVLQPTLRGRMAQGAVRGLVGVTIPENPLKSPLVFTRQMLGFSHDSEILWFPGAGRMADGLEKITGSAFAIKGAAEVAAEGDLRPAFEAADAFARPSVFRPRIQPWQASVANEALIAATSAPNQRMFATVGYTDLDEETVAKAYRTFHGYAPSTKLDPDKLAKFGEDITSDMNGARSAFDKQILEQQQAVIDTMTGRVRSVAEQAVQAGQLDQASVEAAVSQSRRIFDTLRRAETLRYESNGLGSAIAARVNLGTLLAHVSNANYRDIVDGAYKGSGARETMREVVGYAAAKPELFTRTQDGRLLLTATRDEMEQADAYFLGALLDRSKGLKSTSFLENHLRKEGIHPDVVQVIDQMGSALAGSGQNLVAEGVLENLLGNYFPRAFAPNDKFLKDFKLLHSEAGNFMERAISGQVTDDRIVSLLDEAGWGQVQDKYRQGKLTFQESRVFTEKLARGMERRGYGQYEKDGLALYAEYMSSANKALLWNRIAINPRALAPQVTQEYLRQGLGAEVAGRFTDEWLRNHKINVVMPSNEVPESMRDLFVDVTSRPRGVSPAEDIKAGTDLAIGRSATSGAEQDVLDAASGQTRLKLKVGKGKAETNIPLVSKATGEPIPFDPSWHTSGKYPEDLKNWKTVKATVDAAVAREVNIRSAKGEAFIGKAVSATSELKPRTVAILRPDYGHVQEAFRLLQKGQVNNAMMRFIDRWNYKLKSTLLLGDVFHYNVLAFSQFASDPLSILAHIKDETGKLAAGAFEGGWPEAVRSSPVLRNAAIGATTGAAVGIAQDRDLPATLGFSAAGALYGASIAAAGKNARAGYSMLVSPDHLDTLLWMGLGGWSGRPDDRAIGVVQRGLKAFRDRLAADQKGSGALVHAIDGIVHVADGWDRQLWDVMQNGSKHFFFSTRWAQEVAKLEAGAGWGKLTAEAQHAAKLDVAKQLVQAANNAFGGQTWRYLLDRPEFQHTLRYMLLSPDWTASRMQGAANIFLNMKTPARVALGSALGTAVDFAQYGMDENSPRWRGPVLGGLLGAGLGKWAETVQARMMTKGDVLARESRRLWTSALVGGYAAMEALNLALSGHSMWENATGKKTEIDLGDGTYVSLGKPWVEPLEFAGIYHADRYPIPVASRLRSKAAVLPLAAINLLSNSDGFGPLITVKDSAGKVAYKLADFAVNLAAPIITQGPVRLGGEILAGQTDSGSLERAGLRAAGFTTTTIPNQQRSGLGLPQLNFPTIPPSLGNPPNLLTRGL